MKPLKTILIDDDPNNLELLSHLIEKNCPEIKLYGKAFSVKDAIGCIKKNVPDLIFLDVELPDGNGFDILNYFKPVPFKVIFITGFLKYAYQAIKFNAVDFLIKPIEIPALIEGVKKVIDRQLNTAYQVKLEGAGRQIEQPSHLVLHEASEFKIFQTKEIIMLEANGSYTDIYLTRNRKLTYCKILKGFKELLKIHPNFMRIHRSSIINLNHVKSFSKTGEINLTENHTATLGNSSRSQFINYFL